MEDRRAAPHGRSSRARARRRLLAACSLLAGCTSDGCPEGTVDRSEPGRALRVCCADGLVPCDGACVPPARSNCGCPRGAARCAGSACVDLLTSRANCGACGRTCPAEEFCVEGLCSCRTGRTRCGAGCTDTLYDARHCGACGRACGDGRACRWGRCVAECPAGRGACAVGAPGACDVDLSRTDAHCGGCFRACPPGLRCGEGACVCDEPARCGGQAQGAQVFANAPTRCGPGGLRCAPGQHCATGACACLPDQTLCASGCAALQRDPANCGACGVACRVGEDCAVGRCAPRLTPRPLWPPSGGVLGTRRPEFRWLPASGEVTGRVEVCRDRACQTPVASWEGATSALTAPTALPAGVLFWRVRSRRAGGAEGESATWEFRLTARDGAGGGLVGHFVDVNGDGFADHVRRVSPSAVCVYPGARGGLRHAVCERYGADPPRAAPADVTPGLGDFDGDGFTDVAVQEERPDPAPVLVLRGGPSGLGHAARFWEDEGPWPLRPFGGGNPNSSGVLRGVGDADGDGYADLTVSGALAMGSLALHGGGGGRWIPWRVLATPLIPAGLSHIAPDHVLINGGDFTGDGRGDFVLQPFLWTFLPYTVRVLPGGVAGLGPEAAWAIPERDLRFGAVAGDFDGDGVCDLGILTEQELEVYHGRAAGLSSAPDQRFLLEARNAAPVTSFDGGRDLNGDGRSDVVVTERLHPIDPRSTSLVLRPLLGAARGFTRAERAPSLESAGAGPPSRWVGDVDRDGFDDVAVDGANGLLLYRGGSDGLSENPSQQLPLPVVP